MKCPHPEASFLSSVKNPCVKVFLLLSWSQGLQASRSKSYQGSNQSLATYLPFRMRTMLMKFFFPFQLILRSMRITSQRCSSTSEGDKCKSPREVQNTMDAAKKTKPLSKE